jgi:hypothetical protein
MEFGKTAMAVPGVFQEFTLTVPVKAAASQYDGPGRFADLIRACGWEQGGTPSASDIYYTLQDDPNAAANLEPCSVEVEETIDGDRYQFAGCRGSLTVTGGGGAPHLAEFAMGGQWADPAVVSSLIAVDESDFYAGNALVNIGGTNPFRFDSYDFVSAGAFRISQNYELMQRRDDSASTTHYFKHPAWLRPAGPVSVQIEVEAEDSGAYDIHNKWRTQANFDGQIYLSDGTRSVKHDLNDCQWLRPQYIREPNGLTRITLNAECHRNASTPSWKITFA